MTRARSTAPRIAPAVPRDAVRLARILGDWVRETPWMPALHDPVEDRAFLARLIREAEVPHLPTGVWVRVLDVRRGAGALPGAGRLRAA
ncbi:MAG: hypothetical protein ACE368_03630 [Paracoccaceae bacterium]